MKAPEQLRPSDQSADESLHAGLHFGRAPDFRPNPAAPLSNLYGVSHSPSPSFHANYELKNDNVDTFRPGGGHVRQVPRHLRLVAHRTEHRLPGDQSPGDIPRLPSPATSTTTSAASSDHPTTTTSLYLYVNENARRFDGTVVVNAGFGHNFHRGRADDLSRPAQLFHASESAGRRLRRRVSPGRRILPRLRSRRERLADHPAAPGARNKQLQDGRRDEVGLGGCFLGGKTVATIVC